MPLKSDLLDQLQANERKITADLRLRLAREQQRLKYFLARPVLADPRSPLNLRRERLENSIDKLRQISRAQQAQYVYRLSYLQERLRRTGVRLNERARERLSALTGRLHALSPLAVLQRGYTVTESDDHRAILTIRQVAVDDKITVRFQDGSAFCRVLSTKQTKNKEDIHVEKD